MHDDKNFILIGRYSKHHEYTKPNRHIFSDNQGCIGKVWNGGGEYFIDKLPQEEQEYFKRLKNEFKIDKKISQNLRMKSRAYYAKALEDGHKRIGIVMFESLQQDVLNQDKLKNIIDTHQNFLIKMLRKTKKINSFIDYQNEREKQ